MIPRIIHRIWLGGDVPEEARCFGDTWRRHNPGWELRMWREWTLPPLANQDQFDLSTHPARQADLLRLEVLLRLGGVYIDTDVEALAPIGPHLNGVECFVAREDAKFIGTAVMGCVPGHPFLARLVKNATPSIERNAGQPPNRQTGPYFVTDELKGYRRTQTGRRNPVVVFPPEQFYPYHFSEPERRFEHFPDAIAVHHWSGSWTEPTSDESAVTV